jgi:hypothetical protein
MDLRDIEWGGIDWIGLAQDRNQWMVVVKKVPNFGFYKMLGNP